MKKPKKSDEVVDETSDIVTEEVFFTQEELDKIEEPKKTKITAFHGIFEDKLNQMIAKIKKLRKDPGSKAKVKTLIAEAKALKKLIKKEKKEHHNHQIQVALRIVDGKIGIDESFPSNRIELSDVRYVGGLLIIDFDLKPLG